VNAEAILASLIAHMERPIDLAERARRLEPMLPVATRRAKSVFAKYYGLLGKKIAHEDILGYISRLKEQMEAGKAESEARKADEPQAQQEMPAGGMRESIEARLDRILTEEHAVYRTADGKAGISPDLGVIVVKTDTGEEAPVTKNHADTLKLLVSALASSPTGNKALQDAVAGIANPAASNRLVMK